VKVDLMPNAFRVGFALALLAGSLLPAHGSIAAQLDEAARALQATISVLGGVPRAQCGPPAAAGTPCVAPYSGLDLAESAPRGIAAFSVTFVNEPGSYVAFFGRSPAGSWLFWYGAQDAQSPLVALPGILLTCTSPSGGAAQIFVPERGVSEALAPLTRLTADEFVLTQPGVPGTAATPPQSGIGWYRISAPTAGWVPETEVTDAMFGNCDVHDSQYRPRSTGAASG
jgi:hypothetical protein